MDESVPGLRGENGQPCGLFTNARTNEILTLVGMWPITTGFAVDDAENNLRPTLGMVIDWDVTGNIFHVAEFPVLRFSYN